MYKPGKSSEGGSNPDQETEALKIENHELQTRVEKLERTVEFLRAFIILIFPLLITPEWLKRLAEANLSGGNKRIIEFAIRLLPKESREKLQAEC